MRAFRSRLIAHFVPLAVVAVLTTGFLSYVIVQREIERGFQDRLADSLAGMRLELNEIGDRLAADAREFDCQPLLDAMVADDQPGMIRALNRLHSALQLDAVRLLDAEGTVLADTHRLGRIGSKMAGEVVRQALAGDEVRELSSSDAGIGMLYCKPLLRDQRQLAVLCLERFIDHRFLTRVRAKFGLDCTIHAGDHLVATTLARFDADDLRSLETLGEQALKTQGVVQTRVRIGGQSALVRSEPVASTGGAAAGVLSVSIPLTALEQSLADAALLIATLALAMAVLVMLLSARIAARVVRPIRQLAAAAHAFAQGEGADFALHTSDEFEALGASFGAMAADLQANTTSIANLNREVAERKAAEQAYAAEHERLAVTLRSIGDAVITTGLDGRITMLNKVAERLLGWTHAEAEGQPLTAVFRIVDAQTGEPRPSPVTTALATGKSVRLANHTNLVSRSGEAIPIADSAAPIFDRGGDIIGAVLVFRDVREEHRRESDRLRMLKLEAVGALAGGIAHDFNNLLTAIGGNIALAILRSDATSKVTGLLREAERATERAGLLTKQLLTFAKGGEPYRRASALPELLVELTEFTLRGSKVVCEFAFPPELWHADIDRGQISQVVQNLVLNARQAMPEGGHVRIACENRHETPPGETGAPARFVLVTIADDGPGMPPEVLRRIFEPYFTTKSNGSGLGLAISHSIVAQHDGAIDVESSPGSGTTFRIWLPAADEEQEAAAKRPVTEQPDWQGQRALIMDDDEQVADATRRMLEGLGLSVVVAADGERALQIYREQAAAGQGFAVVLLDLTVRGGMGGAETMRLLAEFDPEVRGIVVSGYSNDPVLSDFPAFGFRAAVSKPFRLEDLQAALRAALA